MQRTLQHLSQVLSIERHEGIADLRYGQYVFIGEIRLML